MSQKQLRLLFGPCVCILLIGSAIAAPAPQRPNILIAISDDQSFQHTSFAGYPGVSTPHFDRVAKEGVYFSNAIVASPGCSPSRAAFLTGKHTWMIEEAGTHSSLFPQQYVTFTDVLAEAGYAVGYTGKAWGPGDWKASGRTQNPVGPKFGELTLNPPHDEMSPVDYAANFDAFLQQRPSEAPFVFWFGAHEPHRKFDTGMGLRQGKKLEDAPPPAFLPDNPTVRSDLLDYCIEIEWFDSHLGRMIASLEQAGELDNTIIIVTSDNGMSFPRAKANTYEYGIHVPLAIRWGNRAPAGRTIDDVVGFVDLTATLLHAARVSHPDGPGGLSGRSFMPQLVSNLSGLINPDASAYAARERHSYSRHQNATYPQRALRTSQFLYVRNFRPNRWPAGDPEQLDDQGKSMGRHGAYRDIDGCPTLDTMISHRNDPEMARLLLLAVDKRPSEELFDIQTDPDCLHNLAGDPAYTEAKERLSRQLNNTLESTGDPRVLDGGEIWESYPRFGTMRSFPAPDKTRSEILP